MILSGTYANPVITTHRFSIHLELRLHSPSLDHVAQYLVNIKTNNHHPIISYSSLLVVVSAGWAGHRCCHTGPWGWDEVGSSLRKAPTLIQGVQLPAIQTSSYSLNVKLNLYWRADMMFKMCPHLMSVSENPFLWPSLHPVDFLATIVGLPRFWNTTWTY